MEAIIETDTERRRVKRFLFPDDSDITARISIRGQEDAVVISDILNISEDGLGFSFKVNPNPSLKTGDRFVIKEIKGFDSAEFLVGVEMEIKWILRYNPQRGARSGCEFAKKSEVLREKVRRLVDHQMARSLDIAGGG
ncbi:MAG: PilZ domain-containing protein [Pseudomonadota bacterium]